MSHVVTLSPRARDQLVALNAWIAGVASPEIADRYTDAVAEFCFSLATFPERGTLREDIRPGLRITNYRKRTVIAFSVDTDTAMVSILGVFYGGQNYEACFSEDRRDRLE